MKRVNGLSKRILLATPILAGALYLHGGQVSGAGVDAVSAASISVRTNSITTLTATVEYYSDRYNYGTRTLCYDPAPAAARNNCVSRQANGYSGSFAVSGLKPGTKYNFRVEAKDGRHSNYNTTGSFTTTAPTGVVRVSGRGPADPAVPRVDAAGRSLPPGPAAPCANWQAGSGALPGRASR